MTEAAEQSAHDQEIRATFEAQCEGLPLLDGERPAFADSLRKATLGKLREQYADTIASNIDDRLAAAETKPDETDVPGAETEPPAPIKEGTTPPPAL